MPLAWGLSAMGYATLLVDYRGYGGNPGSPSEEGLAIDARAALAHVESRDDVNADRIAYFGESLGASVAVLLAVERPPSALIFRSPFTSLADVGSVQLPLLPVSLLLRDRFDSSAKIADIRVPVLIVAGNDDALVSGTDESRPLRARDSAEGVRRNRRCRPQRSGASERDLLLGAVDRHLSDAFG
jgi:fermentation-respiration switch protein FrsA (DUF1100 family)